LISRNTILHRHASPYICKQW